MKYTNNSTLITSYIHYTFITFPALIMFGCVKGFPKHEDANLWGWL